MPIKVFNTFTREIEELVPHKEGTISVYVCGPTVYDFSHIGHARTYLAFDVIVRYLRYRGYKVQYVVNITNVEDKILKRAKEARIDPVVLADGFEKAFYEDMDNLGVVKADVYPRVSDHIGEIVDMIKTLVQKGFAYEVEGDVYFEVSKFNGYGNLSGQSLDSIKAGARVEINEKKKSPADFALWKKSGEDEIYWISPWGKGRPGWHIECSAMAFKHLGAQIDIHGGGQDLIFPHHENEIAQSESSSGKKPAVKYWLHIGLLTLNGEKMSKSLANFVLIKDLLKKYEADVIRLYIISAHYRRPIDFKESELEKTKLSLVRIRNTIDRLNEKLEAPLNSQKRVANEELLNDVYRARKKFINAMDDDLNTPKALAVFYQVIKIGNKVLETNANRKLLSEVLILIMEIAQVFGILEKKKEKRVLTEKAKRLLEQREEARKMKNWEKADELRVELRQMGIILEDLPEGTRWSYHE